MLLSKKWITKALIWLLGCAGWSAPVLLANPWRPFFSRCGPYFKYLSHLWFIHFLYTALSHEKILPGHVAQSVTCLATDASLTADPGIASSIPTRPYFMEIDLGIISTVILLPSPESFKKGCWSVPGKSMCTKYWLTACLSLPRKKCG